MISSFIATIVCVVVFYLVGSLILLCFKINQIEDRFANVFVKTILGFLFSSTIYSIVKTSGNTISWGFIFVFFIFLSYYKRNDNVKKGISLKESFGITCYDLPCWLTIFVTSLLFVLANGYFFYGKPFNFEPHFDYNYYAAVADEIAVRGVESNNVMRDILRQREIAPTPYHYIELWATSMISSLFRINSTETIFIIVYALLGTLLVIGLFALVSQYKNNLIFYIIAVFAIFYVPIAYFDYTIGFNVFKVLNLETIFTSLINTKTQIVAVFFVFSILLYKYDKNYFLISLLFLPIVNIVLAPSIFIAVGCLLLQSIKKSKKSFVLLLETIGLGVFIICFYVLQSRSDSFGNFSRENIEGNIVGWSSIVKSTIKLIMFLLIYHLPIILMLFYYRKKDKIAIENLISRNDILIISTSILLLTGFIFAQLTKGVRDNTQFYALATEILPIVYVIFVFEFLVLSNKLWEQITIIIVCLFFFVFSLHYNTFQVENPYPFSTDVKFLNDVENSVSKTNSKVVASLDVSYSYPYPLSSQTDIYLRTIYIGERNMYAPIVSTFTAFCDNREKSSGKITLDTLQYEFLLANNIKQIVSKSCLKLPNCIEDLVDTTYVSEEGKVFYLLK
ncbi:MAG: hypothetical protein MJ198_07320 [Bacteroidales bacterium]|nr:hypothetical protein [Bacteroidales bacterium]